jgi:glutamate synthase domain-containing protein 3
VNRDIIHWKAQTLDFSKILYFNKDKPLTIRCSQVQDHGLETSMDNTLLIGLAKDAIENKTKFRKELPIRNIHRTVGTMLSGTIAKKYGSAGLPEDTIHFKFNGCAGQSFGAFLAPGVTLELEGYANDYLGKGLSGGRIIVYPPKESSIIASDNIIVGNTLLYGATSGEIFISGVAGERFAVRNSGTVAVIEGVGDHGCEYMTGGTVVVLGKTGRNFAAGMSGGIAYVYDENQLFDTYCNFDMVDLEPVIDRKDRATLKTLIARHHEYTGSAEAKRILDSWDESLDRFVKVFPIDYKKALERIKAHELENNIGTEVTEEVYGE